MSPDQVRAVRDELGLSVPEFALLIGVDTQQIRDWETGKRRGRTFVCHASGEAAIRYALAIVRFYRSLATWDQFGTPSGLDDLLDSLPKPIREKA